MEISNNSTNNSESVNDLDKWIEKLNECKPLTENEIKALCEMVSFYNFSFV
jgi:hypothetical protein